MPRYIDADALSDWIVNEPSKVGDKDIPLNNEYDGSTFRQIEILGHIDTMPTADVAKVVQCKDCKHYKRSKVDPNRKMCWRKDVDGFLVCYDFYPTDYCSYGERRK